MNIYTLMILVYNCVLSSSIDQVCIPSPKWEGKTVLVNSLDFSHSYSIQRFDFASCVQHCYFNKSFEIIHFNTSTHVCICFKTKKTVFSYRSASGQLFPLAVYMQETHASKQ